MDVCNLQLPKLVGFAFTPARNFTEVSDASLGDGQSPQLRMRVPQGLPAPIRGGESPQFPGARGISAAATPFQLLPSHFIAGSGGSRNLPVQALLQH